MLSLSITNLTQNSKHGAYKGPKDLREFIFHWITLQIVQWIVVKIWTMVKLGYYKRPASVLPG